MLPKGKNKLDDGGLIMKCKITNLKTLSDSGGKVKWKCAIYFEILLQIKSGNNTNEFPNFQFFPYYLFINYPVYQPRDLLRYSRGYWPRNYEIFLPVYSEYSSFSTKVPLIKFCWNYVEIIKQKTNSTLRISLYEWLITLSISIIIEVNLNNYIKL